MAIDRVTPSNPALSIHDRQVREIPGQVNAQPVPPVAQPPGDTPEFSLQGGLPAAVGALIEAMEGAQPGQAAAKSAAAAGAAAGAMLAQESLSMQPNQLFPLRQLVWHNPDTSLLAASWQVMVRTYSEQRAAMLQQNEGRHVPASLFMADPPPAVLRDSRPYPGLISDLDAWRFAVYAWGAEKLTLRVVARDPGEEEAPDQPRRRRPRVAVRLEMNLPDIGKVVVQMEPAELGVVLEIGAHTNEAMQQMRELLPQIATIIGRCGLQIVRARLMRELTPVNSLDNDPSRAQISLLSKAVFKAMAEVAVFLSQPRLPNEALSA
ncbi:hypothetical protein [Pseudoduganella violaceinigra]|uniref:hypothetical protein n=1 Tax=Pseudoduganella violaceinigra TaxID=246602 RepID=UPI000417D42A|nr:hypothetical protein [Pseudoduganella violaceinigra]